MGKLSAMRDAYNEAKYNEAQGVETAEYKEHLLREVGGMPTRSIIKHFEAYEAEVLELTNRCADADKEHEEHLSLVRRSHASARGDLRIGAAMVIAMSCLLTAGITCSIMRHLGGV